MFGCVVMIILKVSTLRFQESSDHKGFVGFPLNSFADCTIEFIQNATLVQSASIRSWTDMNGLLERLTYIGEYC